MNRLFLRNQRLAASLLCCALMAIPMFVQLAAQADPQPDGREAAAEPASATATQPSDSDSAQPKEPDAAQPKEPAAAQSSEAEAALATEAKAEADAAKAGPPTNLLSDDGAAPEGLIRLSKDGEVWLDTKRKLVVVDGEVCLRRGPLEMFACPKGTKEHESIVAVNAPASVIHAGLLAIGAKPGSPVRFRPEYRPPTGSEIDVWVLWRDQEGKPHKERAQKWIRNVRTMDVMKYSWVFAGSGFWQDEISGQRRYHGDAGDFICVSNFPTATLDIPVESSQSDEQLLFEAFTDHIPNMGTKVRLVLSPVKPQQPVDQEEGKNP